MKPTVGRIKNLKCRKFPNLKSPCQHSYENDYDKNNIPIYKTKYIYMYINTYYIYLFSNDETKI